MCNVWCFDVCMCLHAIDSTTQKLQELWQNIFSLLLFVLQRLTRPTQQLNKDVKNFQNGISAKLLVK